MSIEEGGFCWGCNIELSASDYGRQDSCHKCGKDTHACKGCYFYDPSCHNECREPQADRVVDKEKANFCDYFKPRKSPSSAAAVSSKDALKAAAEALFKKK